MRDPALKYEYATIKPDILIFSGQATGSGTGDIDKLNGGDGPVNPKLSLKWTKWTS
jgi:hypothetical protein